MRTYESNFQMSSTSHEMTSCVVILRVFSSPSSVEVQHDHKQLHHSNERLTWEEITRDFESLGWLEVVYFESFAVTQYSRLSYSLLKFNMNHE
jgi:hypothetical protein